MWIPMPEKPIPNSKKPNEFPAVRVNGKIYFHSEGHDMALDLASQHHTTEELESLFSADDLSNYGYWRESK